MDNNDTSENTCEAARDSAIFAKDLWLKYRLMFVLIYLFFINVFLDKVNTKVLPRLRVYKYLKAETCQELGMRMLQLFLGPIIFLVGVVFLIYQAATGCNIHEIYVIWIGGSLLVSVDVHEFVRRWPLRPPLLAHHIMTFAIAMAFVEFQVLPPNEEKLIEWATVLFLSFIGLMWTIDFYHVVYRCSENLKVITKFRTVYLWLAPVRITNIFLLASGTVQTAIGGVWFGFFCLLFMTFAYAYNSYKAITFVLLFDCVRYYESHQEKWFATEEEERLNSSRPALSTKNLSRRPTLTKATSGFASQLTIPLLHPEEESPKILPGLGGDKTNEEVEDFEVSFSEIMKNKLSFRNVMDSNAADRDSAIDASATRFLSQFSISNVAEEDDGEEIKGA